MARFEISIEGQPDTARTVGAHRVRQAVSLYWNERVVDGKSSAAERTRLVVKHPDGPSIDPAMVWYTKGDAVFTMVDVQVASVEIAVFDVDVRAALRESSSNSGALVCGVGPARYQP